MADDFILEKPVYSGSGCESGSGEFFLSSGNHQIYLSTPGYASEWGERKVCMVVLPVQAMPGKTVAIESVRVKFRSDLPADSTSVFQAEMFLAGLRSPAQNFILEGPSAQEQSFVIAPEPERLFWSGCGQSANLRLNTNLISSEGSMRVISLRVRLVSSSC